MTDLTDDELVKIMMSVIILPTQSAEDTLLSFARAAIFYDRSKQQERKPHTEEEVQQILSIGPMRSEFADHLEVLVRRILGVPAP